ncbi:MAG: hypothetical protein Q4A74_02750, partial [Cardiobacteriaceae bacterium]|nr:hypothetical protein [Cardiobacteriaceae bacterium]
MATAQEKAAEESDKAMEALPQAPLSTPVKTDSKLSTDVATPTEKRAGSQEISIEKPEITNDALQHDAIEDTDMTPPVPYFPAIVIPDIAGKTPEQIKFEEQLPAHLNLESGMRIETFAKGPQTAYITPTSTT